ncbi:glutamate receptor ionotropic, kainate 2-like isoform X1 [Homalodisca vitripennis]|uniref:glutamate receptor ionotropic, kainate 2-like isoform X1 n=2 Tax=Homalodisca vitripennis TaxID=197043 RepID=UPI001EE9ED1E|nr:glutamate receptor ionotropic, kainate 2-like isoform X1 [Homalodisca vitripennis]
MWWMLLGLLAYGLAVSPVAGVKQRANYQRLKDDFTIVGLFHPEQKQQEFAFSSAIEAVNMDSQVIPYTNLVPRIEYFSHFDSFNTSKRVCTLLEEGVGAIFGPQSVGTTGIVQSICDNMEIPHIDLRWDISAKPSGCVINLYPDSKLLATALINVIRDMDWKSYTVLYEDYDSLIRLQEVFKDHEGLSHSEGFPPFTVRQLPSEDDDYRPLLKELKTAGESHIVLDCPTDKIMTILTQANEVKLMGEYLSIILTSLDAHTIDYGVFRYDRTNITALRLIDPNSATVMATLHDWEYEAHRKHQTFNLTATDLQIESLLMFDAVRLFALALDKHGGRLQPERLDCHSGRKWEHGFGIINFMKNMEYEGVSGPMRFNEESGHRDFFSLEIIELANEGFKKIGTWDPEHGINYTRTVGQMYSDIVQSITTKKFIVTSRIGRPYLEYTENHQEKEGNARYEGYSMDLIDSIAKELGFKYEFQLVEDKQYGTLDKKTKQWNGLIRELREKKADLAICDLTITYDRRSAVDFTMPFMTLGISILYKKPEKPDVKLFSFLSPLAFNVWVTMATAYLGISLLLYILSRCSPYQWENPHPCNSDPEELELTFNLSTCLWFSIGSLTTQGCDLLPKAVSTRIVAGMWWFFTLIMISSYTANLAAFITQQKMDNTIDSAEDLVNQNKVKYGVMADGSSYNFFRESNDSLYQKIWSNMQSATPSVFTDNNDEGVDRVRKAKNRGYAFFMESTTIEFQVEQYCELTQIGGTLDSKGYGIAMPSDSPYRTAISGAVLKLQESGKLRDLKTKWWSSWKPNNTYYCNKFLSSSASSNGEFDMDNVGGVFIVLLGGCSLSFLVAIFEFLWNVRKVAVTEKISPMEAFMLELKFAVRCHGTTKPVRLLPSESSPKDSLHGSFLQLDMFPNNKEPSHARTPAHLAGWTPDLDLPGK